MKTLLVAAEAAAQMLGLSRGQVYGMARKGELPSVRVGRLLRFSTEELEQWVRGQTEAGANEPPASTTQK